MSRPKTEGFQKPRRPAKTKEVKVAVVKDDPAGAVECSCGDLKFHPRKKVREDWAERHLNEKHAGMGVWM
jgi:hypothetical protein